VKVFVAIAICKILYFIGKLIGKGSSLPGMIALKVCPDALKHLKLPKHIIAITGSNGKTSTAELIAHALSADGKSVGWNHEGSNQTEGVATLLLRVAAFNGKVKKDALVLECDERYARQIFMSIKPSALVVTNLCRDQLTRNGHHEFISDHIQRAIDEAGSETVLVLNADDPYVSKFGNINSKQESDEAKPSPVVIWFGVSADFQMSNSGFKVAPKYDDGAFCPVCKSAMRYDYRIAGNYGAFSCSSCNFRRQQPDFEVRKLDYDSGEIVIVQGQKSERYNPADSDESPRDLTIKTRLDLPSLVGAYNLAATLAAVSTAGISAQTAANSLDRYKLKGGRAVRFTVGGREGILLISKHENSLAYDQSLIWAVGQRKPCTVVVLVSDISRKYYTSETSWMWDIDFDIAADDMVRNIVLAGKYANELAMRFALTDIDQKKIGYLEDVDKLREYIEHNTHGDIYVLTCFSDKAKLMSGLGI